MNALLILHLVLCVVLLYTVFCRACQTDHTVRLEVRFAFFVLGSVACFGLVAPLLGQAPTLYSVALLAAICLVQVLTARYWRAGVPACFYKPGRAPLRQATDFRASEVRHGHA